MRVSLSIYIHYTKPPMKNTTNETELPERSGITVSGYSVQLHPPRTREWRERRLEGGSPGGSPGCSPSPLSPSCAAPTPTAGAIAGRGDVAIASAVCGPVGRWAHARGPGHRPPPHAPRPRLLPGTACVLTLVHTVETLNVGLYMLRLHFRREVGLRRRPRPPVAWVSSWSWGCRRVVVSCVVSPS